MRFVWRLLLLVLAVVLIAFAASNRERVPLGLWPLPDVVEAPLYLVVLAALGLGFILGELTAWIGARHWRREARQGRRHITALEAELAAAEARAPDGPAAPREGTTEPARLTR